jgi:hypothetical protein
VPHILRSISSSYNSIKLFLILSHPRSAVLINFESLFAARPICPFYLWGCRLHLPAIAMPSGFVLQSKVKPIASNSIADGDGSDRDSTKGSGKYELDF